MASPNTSLQTQSPTPEQLSDAMERIRTTLFARGNRTGEDVQRRIYEEEDRIFDHRIPTVQLIEAVESREKGWTCSKKYPMKVLRRIDAQFAMLVNIPKFSGRRKSHLIEKLLLQRDFILTELKSIGFDVCECMSRSRQHFREKPIPCPREQPVINCEIDVAKLITDEITKPVEGLNRREVDIDIRLKSFKGTTVPELVSFTKEQIGKARDYDEILSMLILNEDIANETLQYMMKKMSRDTLSIVETAIRDHFAENDDEMLHTGNINNLIAMRERYFHEQ
jgi:hypothetical protein